MPQLLGKGLAALLADGGHGGSRLDIGGQLGDVARYPSSPGLI